jgi:hypothetical protein
VVKLIEKHRAEQCVRGGESGVLFYLYLKMIFIEEFF